jgi:MFS family permease
MYESYVYENSRRLQLSSHFSTIRRPAALLTTVFITQFLVALDVALLNVALPAIARDLGFGAADLHWVVNAYLLTFAGLMLLGGRLGDLWGRRRTLLVGLSLFFLFSVLGTVALTPDVLIVARAGQGLAGALIAPASLALVTVSFGEGKLRSRALGLWSAASASGGAVGVALSGILTQTLGWRSVLAVNLPIVAIAIVATVLGVTGQKRSAKRVRLDVGGAVLVFAVTAGNDGTFGWFGSVGGYLAAAVLLVAFVVVEARSVHPLMPLRLFRMRSLVGANVFGFLLSAGQLAAFYFCSLFIQQIWGLEPATAGVLFLPFCAFVVVGIVLAQRLHSVVGPRLTLLTHGLVGAGGLAWFALLPNSVAIWQGIIGPSALAAIGIGGCLVILGSAATSGVAARDAGVASGVLNSSRQLGGTIGLAVLVAIAAGVTARTGSETVAAVADGYRAALAAAAILLGIGAVLSYLIIPSSATPNGGPSHERSTPDGAGSAGLDGAAA